MYLQLQHQTLHTSSYSFTKQVSGAILMHIHDNRNTLPWCQSSSPRCWAGKTIISHQRSTCQMSSVRIAKQSSFTSKHAHRTAMLQPHLLQHGKCSHCPDNSTQGMIHKIKILSPHTINPAMTTAAQQPSTTSQLQNTCF